MPALFLTQNLRIWFATNYVIPNSEHNDTEVVFIASNVSPFWKWQQKSMWKTWRTQNKIYMTQQNILTIYKKYDEHEYWGYVVYFL